MRVRIIQQGRTWIIVSADSGVLIMGDFVSKEDAIDTCTLMNWTIVEETTQ